MRIRYLAILLLGIALALVVLQGRSMAQTGGQEALDDPIALGAWLYQGNCVSCHGTYGRERVGKGLDEDELLEAIEGGSGGCSVDWSIRQGGSLRVVEIKALAAFILALSLIHISEPTRPY